MCIDLSHKSIPLMKVRFGELLATADKKLPLSGKPHREYLQAHGLRQKRYGQIIRDEVSPTLEEAEAIAAAFGLCLDLRLTNNLLLINS